MHHLFAPAMLTLSLLLSPPPPREAEQHLWWPAQVYDKNSHDLQILKHATAWEELCFCRLFQSNGLTLNSSYCMLWVFRELIWVIPVDYFFSMCSVYFFVVHKQLIHVLGVVYCPKFHQNQKSKWNYLIYCVCLAIHTHPHSTTCAS